MKTYDLWKKIILAKVYLKSAVTIRMNTIFAVNQVTPDEYTELINLIETTYSEVA